MRAGKLDRQLTIRRLKEVGRDEYNAPIIEWHDVVTVWAQQRPDRGSERFTTSQLIGTAVMTFHIGYRSDLSVQDRIFCGGLEYEIIAPPREIGRRIGIEIDAVARDD